MHITLKKTFLKPLFLAPNRYENPPFLDNPLDSKKDIPSLEGKVVIVTGGTSGLGQQSDLEFARHGAKQLWLASRNLEKIESVISDIKKELPDASISPLELNLASFESIQKAAKTIIAETDRIDILILNAGIVAVPAAQISEGYEIQFGTNHVGHALLTKLLMPALLHTAEQTNDVRIVFVSSDAFKLSPGHSIRFETLKTPGHEIGTWARYGQSKLANILHTRELAKHYPSLSVTSIHPSPTMTAIKDPLIRPIPSYTWLCLLCIPLPTHARLAHGTSFGHLYQKMSSPDHFIIPLALPTRLASM
ncbi:oxidoreductase [Xylogone sp. PMI_703]|nr:oxidoreductase [Xylogone sp. PMI_703]